METQSKTDNPTFVNQWTDGWEVDWSPPTKKWEIHLAQENNLTYAVYVMCLHRFAEGSRKKCHVHKNNDYESVTMILSWYLMGVIHFIDHKSVLFNMNQYTVLAQVKVKVLVAHEHKDQSL